MTKTAKKVLSKILCVVLYVVLFIVVFAISALLKFNSVMGLGGNYTLQGAYADPLTDNEMSKEIIDIKYITNDGSIDTRPVMLYKPKNVSGDLPLVFIPHYAAEENTEDFVSYIKNGWAVAAAHDFKTAEYNAALVTDNLVFNNAALYTLRNMEGIDKQRIVIVGGSAGGYMTMMLTQLQMGTTASIANSPITNIYFNFHIHFLECDEVNKNSGMFEFKMPYQGMVSKYFRPINDLFENDEDPLWEAVSPVSMARAISSPTVINHFTSDLLVPIDQTTKTYSYDENDGSLPKDFTACLGSNYPGILSKSLEELANPDELFIKKYELENQSVDMEMPYSDKLLTINVYDDGKVGATSSHMATNVTGTYKIMPFLQEMMSRTLKGTEQLVPEKVMLMLERYEGNSLALPAHTGVDDTVYGSLAIYQKEIVDELSVYKNNHSMEDLEETVIESINELSENDSEKQIHLDAWNEIKSKLN